jgi:hypothetical protein
MSDRKRAADGDGGGRAVSRAERSNSLCHVAMHSVCLEHRFFVPLQLWQRV